MINLAAFVRVVAELPSYFYTKFIPQGLGNSYLLHETFSETSSLTEPFLKSQSIESVAHNLALHSVAAPTSSARLYLLVKHPSVEHPSCSRACVSARKAGIKVLLPEWQEDKHAVEWHWRNVTWVPVGNSEGDWLTFWGSWGKASRRRGPMSKVLK